MGVKRQIHEEATLTLINAHPTWANVAVNAIKR